LRDLKALRFWYDFEKEKKWSPSREDGKSLKPRLSFYQPKIHKFTTKFTEPLNVLVNFDEANWFHFIIFWPFFDCRMRIKNTSLLNTYLMIVCTLCINCRHMPTAPSFLNVDSLPEIFRWVLIILESFKLLESHGTTKWIIPKSTFNYCVHFRCSFLKFKPKLGTYILR